MKTNIGRCRVLLRSIALGVIVFGQCGATRAEDALQIHNLPVYSLDDTVTAASDTEDASDANKPSATVGQIEVVRERYPDGKVKIERQVTLDAEGNYVNHGAWRLYSPTETVVAEGSFDMGKRVGNWTRWLDRNDSPLLSKFPYNRFKPPFASQAVFNDGAMEGEWLVVDADSRRVLQISYAAGKRQGMVISFLPNGDTYRQESYDQGVPVGDMLEVDGKSGELKRVATYVDGRRIVTKTEHFRRGKQKKSEEMYLAAKTVETSADDFWNVKLAEYGSEGKDLRHGPSKVWYENGQTQVEGVYRNDKRSGTFAFWYSNGQISAMGSYTDDQPDGDWVWWHQNGQKASIGQYEQGMQIGQWRWWQETGKLAETKVFDGNEAVAEAAPKPPAEIRLGRMPGAGSMVK